MSDWQPPLLHELANWQAANLRVPLWWRDDDACTNTPALQKLLQIAIAHASPPLPPIPLSLAVIPHAPHANLPTLTPLLLLHPTLTILQHGHSHTNHAPPTQKKSELGNATHLHRPLPAILAELQQGFTTLTQTFPAHFHPILTPPWNRIATPLLTDPRLPAIGYHAISTFADPPPNQSPNSLPTLNTHIDLINWKTRKFIGATQATQTLTTRLHARRTTPSSQVKPLGILTHHLAHDPPTWQYLTDLLTLLRTHPAIHWQTPRTLLPS